MNVKMPRVSITQAGRTPTFSSEARRRLLEVDPRWRAKSIIRAVAVLFSLLGFSLFAAAIPAWDDWFFWAGGPSMGDWQDGLPLGILVFAFLYNSVMIFLLLKRKIAVHPIVPLVVDLLVWAALVAAITYASGLGAFWLWNIEVEIEAGPVFWAVIKKIGGLELAGIVFACFVWVCHFVLFVLACIDTHKWRKNRKANRNQSPRGLEHQDFVRSEQDAPTQPPPVYDDNGLSKDIEMSLTSPAAREFV